MMRRKGEPQLHRWQPVGDRPQKPSVVPSDAPVSVLERNADLLVKAPPGPGELPPPGTSSIEPIPLLWPMGGTPGSRTEFKYLYDQLIAVDNTVQALGGGGPGGTIVLTNTTQNFTTNQTFTLDTPGGPTTTAPVGIIANDAATGVSYPLELVHTYAPGVGPVGLGVGLNLLVETDSEGTRKTIGTLEGQSRTNTAGTLDGSIGLNVTGGGTSRRVLTFDKDQFVVTFPISDAIPAGGGNVTLTYRQLRTAGSGQRSLLLDRPANDANPHGFELSMGGDPKWGWGMDADAINADTTDMVLCYSYKIAANGRDIFRVSHRPLGSGGVKAIFGQGIGSPANETNCWVIEADSSVGGLEVRTSHATRPTLKLVKQGGGNFTQINMHDKFATGSDFAGSGGQTWYLRDLLANAHRLFMDGSGNLGLGGTNAPVSKLCILAAPSPSANVGLFSLGDGGFSGGANNFAGSASGTGIASNHPSGYAGNLIDLQVAGATKFRVQADGTILKNGVALGGLGDALIGASNAWSAAQTFTLDDGLNNAPSYPLRLRHTYNAGPGANNIGAGLQFEVENASAGISTLANLFVQADNAATANLTSSFWFQVFRNAIQRTMLQINSEDVRLPQQPVATANYGLLSVGGGGFAGGGGNFAGSAAGTMIAGNQDPGFAGDWLNLQEDGNPRFKVAGNGEVSAILWDANNSSIGTAVRAEHRLTAGSVANGFGTAVQLRGWDDIGAASEFYGSFEAEVHDHTASGLATDLILRRRAGNSITEVARWDTGGTFTLPQKFAHQGATLGFFSKTPAAQQTGGAATAGGTYTAAEQTMLNACYSSMRAYGLLT